MKKEKRMFNWWKKKQEQMQEESGTPIDPTIRYKVIQHIVTGKWAVLDTETTRNLDLASTREFWWGSSSEFYGDTWTDDKKLVENVVQALHGDRTSCEVTARRA